MTGSILVITEGPGFGARSRTLLNGTAVPSDAQGLDGDFYIRTSNWTIYGPKSSGAWGSPSSLIGPQGANGSNGTNGSPGLNGKSILNGTVNPTGDIGVIGDFYINTATHHIFGPKTESGWPAGVSLIGPQGEPGSGGGSGSTIITAADTVSTAEDTPVSGNVLSNDSTSLGGSSLYIMQYTVTGINGVFFPGQTASIPGVGSFIMYADGEWSFTPALNYNGVVPRIRYQASNGLDLRLSSLVITVTAVNDGPVANSNASVTDINQPVTINLLQNDSDPEGQSLTLTHINGSAVTTNSVVSVTNGSILVNNDQTITVTPDTDFEGQITFTYTVSDGALTATGNVLIKVGYENIPLFSPVSPLLSGDVFDDAAYNFGLTAMQRHGAEWNNGVNVTSATYSSGQGAFVLTAREPWLYDRATAIYTLYLRTGDTSIRDHALDLADQYMSGVTITGQIADFVTGGGTANDPKYLYPIVAWWYERETNSPVYREKAAAMYQNIITNQPQTYSAGAALWTERNVSYCILGCLAQYWITGDPDALANAEAYFEMVLNMSAATGAPLHPHSQHEGTSISTPITSPWMGAFLVEAAIQLYRTNEDIRILGWISDYCDFVVEHGLYVNTEVDYFLGLRCMAYLVGESIYYPSDGGPYDDGEHAYDLAVMLQKGIWAKQQIGAPVTTLQGIVSEFLEVAENVFLYWTRDTVGYPRYRVNPPRKYAWWFRNAYSKVYSVGLVPLGPINVVLPSISGSAVQGSTLTCSPGTWRGNPEPMYSYQWYREGVVISGANRSTYTTVIADVGMEMSCAVTATNTGGSVVRGSDNPIIVTPAGAPTITDQPDNVSAVPGDNVTFSIVADGSPTPTYQWQYSTDFGGLWMDIEGATSNTLSVSNVNSGQNNHVYRCVVTNVVGSVNSNSATLYVVGPITAVRFDNSSQGARFLTSLLPASAVNFTIEALVRIEGPRASADYILENRYNVGRTAIMGTNNTFEQYNVSVGDTQTGFSGGGAGANPTTNVWYLMTLSGDSVSDTGSFRITFQEVNNAGATQYVGTRAKGFGNNLPHLGIALNGGGDTSAGMTSPISFQYVRAYNSQRDLATIANDRTSIDLTGALFWWVFMPDGSGGVTTFDVTGNNRIPTLNGGTIVTDGPILPQLGGSQGGSSS